ncbi:endoplasmic reticulum protein [Auriculariales sp. MPI-PUGE-AT-0066]|nr:endoplasmic reticulum protein [Auriculariales sp. MPI-PUGE-AT-0066]
MLRSLTILAVTLPATLSQAALTGVEPSKAALYEPVAGSNPPTWKCLNDSSRVIPFSAVNDDYCDCPDGSDEPGTSACPNSSFYCHNSGHIGAYITGASVNDGLCEPDCCDGSDEPAGVCPNVCKDVGVEHRKKMEGLLKIRKTGAKIRGTYVAFAQKEKTRLEESLVELIKDIAIKEKELVRLEDVLTRSESVSQAAMEHKRQSPLYQELLVHSRALKSLQTYYRDLQEREKTLADILSTLKGGYNPNYQDMAVLEAVRGWDAYSGGDSTSDDIVPVTTSEEGSTPEALEGDWLEDEIDNKVDNLLGHDYENLLIQHDEHVSQGNDDADSELFDIAAYLPDALADKYETVRESTVSWLTTLGVIRKSAVKDNSAELTNTARQERDSARRKLDDAKRKKTTEEDEIKKLFDPQHYGADGEWRKLKDTCLSKDSGEYTYEVCLFGNANQKSKNGGSNNLGRFSSWNTAEGVVVGSPEYYSVQKYTNGARCWNGPERSVTVKFECGTENALHAVSEPEKCEYHLTGTSPALCLPVSKDGQHEEL